MTTVRDACFDVMRAEGMTTIFSNPGSTEIPFLVDLPADIRFVLALHEGSVVGIAAGHALGSGSPAFVLLHTTRLAWEMRLERSQPRASTTLPWSSSSGSRIVATWPCSLFSRADWTGSRATTRWKFSPR